MTKATFLFGGLTAAVALALAGCGKKATNSVTINQKGSDTLVQVAQAWSETYKKVNPGAQVNVAGGLSAAEDSFHFSYAPMNSSRSAIGITK